MKIKGRIILLTLVLLVSSFAAFGQKSIGDLFIGNEQRGDLMFADLYYEQAITYYQLALKKNNVNQDLLLKIANSYRLLSDYASSVEWYDKAFNTEVTQKDSIHFLYYADGLMSAGRFDEALAYYEKFASVAANDSRIGRKIEAARHLALLKQDSSTVAIDRLSFNSKYNDLAAIRYDEGLLFLSARPTAELADHDFLREEHLLDFFYVEYDSLLGWKDSRRLKPGLNSKYFEGPATLSADENEIILTRSNIVMGKPITNAEGKTQVQLYRATKSGSEWLIGKKLNFCNTEYSYADPALNSTGDTLYFSSDVPDGYGGNDIYRSVLVDGEWGTPVNMGPEINTEGNELHPFYIDDRLFFSSNGHGGLGGYDIQKAFLLQGVVVSVVNIGSPVNSGADDIAYRINPETLNGYFTSNRSEGMGGDDIYSFETKARILAGIVMQEQDGSRIEGAKVELSQYGMNINETTTDSLGQFRFQLPVGEENFDVKVSREEHRAILPVRVPNSISRLDLDTLMITLHKDDLFARGRILDNETQKLMDQVRVVLHNATDNDFDTLLTDENGTYSFVLLPDKTFNIWATKAGYLFGEANINTYEIDSGVIINDIVLELEYEKKSLVYFDFDKYYLSSETKAVLRRTAQAMKRTTHQLIVSAYADARGTVEYNQKLSDKRANAVLEYLLAQGVDRSRIIARGFGEALILNRCVDGVNCEEVEHSQNRRAEIKIEGSTVR